MILRGLLPLVALTAAIPALAAENDQQFQGASQHTELDCDGGSLRVEGASNILSIRGNCTALTIEGAANEIDVAMAPGGRISVMGASNRIRWTAPAGTRALVRAQGADNQVIRAR